MNQANKPEIYQGFKRTHTYFEGWYFKLVTADLRYSLALIPGISLAKKDPHAFIQTFLVKHGQKPTLKHDYLRFATGEFTAERDQFRVAIGMSQFSFEHLHLDLKSTTLTIQGDLQFSQRVPLNQGFLNPSIMGPFAYLPRMECYHGVLSLTHFIKGKLQIHGETVDFTGGKGYLEKDWGTSFPSEYVWLQGNHFPEPTTSFFFSYARIPYLGLRFQGLIAHLYLNGEHYRFATYNGSKIVSELISPLHVEYVIKKGPYRLRIVADVQDLATLPSPKQGRMDQTIKEGLSGQILLWFMKGKVILYQGQTTMAGIEIMKHHAKN
jgi:tocopherol cyclase